MGKREKLVGAVNEDDGRNECGVWVASWTV